MRNVQKVLMGIFLSGVLLGGIGTGIIVKEFSDLSYGGRKLVGTENLVTKEMDFEIPTDGRTVILGYRGYHYRGGWKGSLVEDPSVPVGIVRYEVTYNERMIEPYLFYEEYEEEEAEEPETEISNEKKEPVYAGELYLATRYVGNDFEIIMENKDRILEELKQKNLSSYEIANLTEIIIKVNPETRAYVKDLFFIY